MTFGSNVVKCATWKPRSNFSDWRLIFQPRKNIKRCDGFFAPYYWRLGWEIVSLQQQRAHWIIWGQGYSFTLAYQCLPLGSQEHLCCIVACSLMPSMPNSQIRFLKNISKQVDKAVFTKYNDNVMGTNGIDWRSCSSDASSGWSVGHLKSWSKNKRRKQLRFRCLISNDIERVWFGKTLDV